jgi:hypothetical protein
MKSKYTNSNDSDNGFFPNARWQNSVIDNFLNTAHEELKKAGKA